MKNTLIIIGSIIFVVVFFVVGMFFWPFTAYITGIPVFPYPLILSIVSLLFFIISKIKKVTWSYVFIPLFLCNALETAFCVYRYEDYIFRGSVIRAKQLFNLRHVLANPFGINVLPSNSWARYDYFINDRNVVCESHDGEGIFSLEYKEMIVPFGQTLARNGQTFSQGDYVGVKASDDFIVIPAIYESISLGRNCIIVKKDGKYGALDKMGREKISCIHSEYHTETDRNDHEYIIFEDGYNYHSDNYKYYIYDTDEMRYSSYLFRTNSEIYKVETEKVFILRYSGDYKYGMYNCRSDKRVSCQYDDYYGYDSSRDAYKFRKDRRYSDEDTYIYYYNEDCEQIDKEVW